MKKVGSVSKVEITAPVGSWECLHAAIKAGADSIYFGVGNLNMRARAANNFEINDVKKIVDECKKKKVKTYLTLNTIIYDNEYELIKKICDTAKKSGVNAIIASDFSVIKYANSIGLEVHVSTQANVSNVEAVKFFSKYADVIVLARELTLEQIRGICKTIDKENIKGPNGNKLKVEIFVHGALCVSISGKCYMSLAEFNKSANRGECFQSCRRSYKVIDDETGYEMKVDNKCVMSPSDLCTIEFLDKIIDSGVSILKIEGRGRKADYVYTTVKIYKEAIEAVKEGTFNQKKTKKWLDDLKKVYNRGFWRGGYYLGKKLDEWAGVYGSQSSIEKEYVGLCRGYFPKVSAAHFIIHSGQIKVGDEIMITGEKTGIIKSHVEEIRIDNKSVKTAEKGDEITIVIKEKTKPKDKLFVVRPKSS